MQALWGSHLPATGVKTLYVVVARLRKAIQDEGTTRSRLRTTGSGYLLIVDAGELDAEAFEARSDDGRRILREGDPAYAADILREALAMWRGPALAEVAYEEFAQEAIRLLDELRLGTIEARVDADLQLGRHALLIGELEGLVARNPTRERLVGQLMTALYGAGRQVDALDAYQHTRTLLGAELGLEPGTTLKSLQNRILKHSASLEPPVIETATATAERRSSRSASRLPARTTNLLGREADVVAVIELLRCSHSRLVSVVGVGGVGKTSLAIEIAHRLAGDFADGTSFVDLSVLSHPDDAADGVLRALATTPDPDMTAEETLARVIADKEQLLVLDNFEHLMAGVQLLVTMLEAAPRLTLLVTTRAALHLRAEQCYLLAPLDLPGNHDPSAVSTAPATALFIARAAAHGPRLRLTRSSAEAIATVCTRLDGLPLAVELAATRCGVLSPEEIAGRLDRILPALGSAARDAPKRHRTLRVMLDWSFNLLDREDQRAFVQLSCFAGGFVLESVAAVCHDGDTDRALETLTRLIEFSLVQCQEQDGKTRYGLLETVREYADERLSASGEEEQVKRRHTAYYLALAERAEPHLTSRDQAEWLECLEGEHKNLLAALESSLTFGDALTSLRLSDALSWFWYLHGHYGVGRKMLARALASGHAAPASARAKGLKGAGTLAFLMCDYGRATEMLGAGLTLYRELDDKRGIASSLQVLGSVAREQADYDTATALHEESLSLCSDLEDPQGIARSLNYLGFVAWLVRDHDRARALSAETLERFRKLGDTEGMAWSLLNLAATALYSGDLAAAGPLCEDALSLSRDIGYKEGVAWSLNLLGVVAQREGNLERAATHLAESLAGHVEFGDSWRVASVLEALAGLIGEHGDHHCAARIFGASASLREKIGTPIPACERPIHEGSLAATRHAVDAYVFAAEWRQGQGMSIKRAAAEACACFADADIGDVVGL